MLTIHILEQCHKQERRKTHTMRRLARCMAGFSLISNGEKVASFTGTRVYSAITEEEELSWMVTRFPCTRFQDL
jgi:hypothetical protein